MPYERERQATAFSLEFESALMKNITIIVKSWRLITYHKIRYPKWLPDICLMGDLGVHVSRREHLRYCRHLGRLLSVFELETAEAKGNTIHIT